MARQIKGGAEQDAFTSWRRYYCYLQRAGVAKAIKRGANRRERRNAKKDIREGRD